MLIDFDEPGDSRRAQGLVTLALEAAEELGMRRAADQARLLLKGF